MASLDPHDPALAAAAHSLKGAAGALGATALESLAGRLEHACRTRHPAAEITSLAQQVQAGLVSLVSAIESTLDGPRPEPVTASRAVTSAELDALLGLLQSSDFAAVGVHDRLASALARQYGPAAQELGRALRRFDFDGARRALQSMREPAPDAT